MSAEYQVQLEWGPQALRAHPADVVIVADADAGPTGDALRAAPAGLVLAATLEGADAIAEVVLAEQARLGRRASITIAAAGDAWPDGSLRVSVADTLVAGRVVDALAERGIDFHSPQAAVACAAATALRGAAGHLVRAEQAARSVGVSA
ncbi:hypothetical protein GCM10009846_31590 [Agrococcus versicolor]|uniref:2-phosphosulfolactate phosphatase n=1 Tax=Agrococcus versicolor TaxID=501482 RepID=A0ABP5MRL0_9MICO